MSAADAPPESGALIVLATILVSGGLILSRPYNALTAGAEEKLAGDGLLVAVLSLTTLSLAWYRGIIGLCPLPLLGALIALMAQRLAAEAPSSRTRLLGLSRQQLVLFGTFLAILGASALLAWHGPGGQVQDAHGLIRTLVASSAVVVAWHKRLLGIHSGESDARNLQSCAVWLIAWIFIGHGVATLNPEWLNRHSQAQMPPMGTLGVTVSLLAIWLASLKPGLRRWLPRAVVAFAVLWSIAASRYYPSVMLPMLPVAGLIFGLFLPVRRWPLAMLLWIASLLAPIIALGPDQLGLVLHGLAGTLLLGVSLRLNRGIQKYFAAYAPDAEPDDQGAHSLAGLSAAAKHEMALRSNRMGVATALTVFLAGSAWIYQSYSNDLAIRQEKARLEAHFVAEELAHLLRDVEHVTRVLDLLPLQSIRSQSDYERSIGELSLLAGPGITLQWAPDAVIRYSHPLAGNEQAVGLDLLARPHERADVEQMIKSGLARWSGPFPLVQGGLGMAYRVPVFSAGAVPSKQTFRGLAIGLLSFRTGANLIFLDQEDMAFRVSIANGASGAVQVYQSALWHAGAESAMGLARLDFDSSAHDIIHIKVAADEPKSMRGRGLPEHFQTLVILALLTAWLARHFAQRLLLYRRVQQQLAESGQMRGILDHNLVANILFDDTGKVIWLNRKTCEVFNAPEAQIRRINCLHNPHWQAIGWAQKARATLEDGHLRTVDYQGQGTLGQALDVRVTFSLIRIADKPFLLEQAIDLSMLHSAHRAAEQSEARYRQLFEDAPNAYLIVELGRGEISACNKATETLLGVDRDQIVGQPIARFWPDFQPDGRFSQRVAREILADVEQGRPVRFDWLHSRRDGSEFMADVSVYLTQFAERRAYLVSWNDITARKALEKSLKDSEERFREFMNHSPNIAWIKDEQGRYIYMSGSYGQRLGVSLADRLGKADAELWPPETASKFRENDLSVLQSNKAVTVIETTENPDGSQCYWLSNIFPFTDSTGNRYVGGIAQDISERMELERHLEEANARLEYKVAERTAALEQARAFSDSLLDTMGSVFVLVDAEGRVQRFNQAAQRISGYSLAELQGQPIWDYLVPPEKRDKVRSFYHNLAPENLVAFSENEWITKGGERRLFAWSRTVLRDAAAGVVYVMGIGADITQERVLAKELELHRQHLEQLVAERTAEITDTIRRLELALSAANLGYWHWDIPCRVGYWDTRSFEIYGVVESERTNPVAYPLWTKRVHPDDLAEAEACQQRLLDGADSYQSEFRIIPPDGSVRFVECFAHAIRNAMGETVRISGFSRDITARKNAEKQLALFHTLIESAQEPFYVLDMDDGGRMIHVNEAALRHFGAPRETVLTWHIPDWDPNFTAADLPRLFENIQSARSLTIRSQHRLADGERVPVEVSINYFIGNNEHRFAYGWFKNITERLEYEHLLESAKVQAELASLAKTEFLSNMSHEIRTPLNGVLGLLQLLGHTPLNKQQAGYVEKAYHTSRVLLDVINDILDISRIEAGQIEILKRPFNLRREANAVVVMLDGAASEKGLVLTLDIDPDCPEWLIGDCLRIQQVLLNLGNNAIKFTEQGFVSIHVSRAMATEGKVALRFEVLDSGIGIAATEIERIFERFIQADSGNTRRFGGSGLGLAIVKNLVQAMGGEIRVESLPDQGSRFWFVLTFEQPDESALIADSVKRDESMRQPLAQANSLAGLRILIVEDQEVNQLVLLEMLQFLGAECALAENGAAAVAQVLASNGNDGRDGPVEGKPFDLVLMDIHMPELDGLTATRLLRQEPHLSQLPIVAISAGVQQNERENCLAAGMNDFLAKPITINKLCQVILSFCPAFENAATVPPLPKPISTLVNPPGFDIVGAIANLGGDSKTYARLVDRFLKRLPDTRNALLEQLHQDSAEARIKAGKILHALRGSALTLGAIELAETSKSVETALTENAPPNLEQLSGALEQAFDRALAVFAEFVRSMGSEASADASKGANQI